MEDVKEKEEEKEKPSESKESETAAQEKEVKTEPVKTEPVKEEKKKEQVLDVKYSCESRKMAFKDGEYITITCINENRVRINGFDTGINTEGKNSPTSMYLICYSLCLYEGKLLLSAETNLVSIGQTSSPAHKQSLAG